MGDANVTFFTNFRIGKNIMKSTMRKTKLKDAYARISLNSVSICNINSEIEMDLKIFYVVV